MKLSDKEKVHLRKLKDGERLFYKLRYLFLILAIICFVLAFGGFFYFLSLPDQGAFEKFSNHPMFYILGMASGLGGAMALWGWRGNAVHRLLIKVVEELENEESK